MHIGCCDARGDMIHVRVPYSSHFAVNAEPLPHQEDKLLECTYVVLQFIVKLMCVIAVCSDFIL